MKKIIATASVPLVIGLLIGAGAFYLIGPNIGQGIISIGEARERLLSATSRLLPPETNVSITEIITERGLYKITLNIQGQEDAQGEEVDVYLTKNGSFLLLPPERFIDLDAFLANLTPAEEESEQVFTPEQLTQLTGLAQCLTEKGVRFFGTAECPWCTRQKELFGPATEFLPYIECSPNVATEQELTMCEEAGVRGVPDWRFPGQEPVTGMQSIERIAELSGCEI